MTNHIVKITESQNTDTEKVGILNHISSYIYMLKNFFQKLKAMNRRVYYAGKYALVIGLICLIFLPAVYAHLGHAIKTWASHVGGGSR